MPAAPAAHAPAALAVASDLLGPLEVAPEARYHFAAGLYGFTGARDFALVPAGREGLWWLQSVEESGLVLLVADPFRYFADYAPDLPDAELVQLGADAPGGRGRAPAPGDVALFAVVTLPGAGAATASANLRAPLVLDTRARRGRQVVLPAERRGVCEPITLG
jgi:flagellar assembly factor FliW